MKSTHPWSYRSFAVGVISAMAGLCLLGLIQPPQSLEELEAQGWQPSWKDDEGKWQPPWTGRWEDVAVAVADVDARYDLGFHSSLTYWHSGWLPTTRWTHISTGNLTEPLHLEGPATILIEGDCLADISVSREALIHILGDVKSTIQASDHSEIVIGGTVEKTGIIETGPIVKVFVRGDFDGMARDCGSHWWIGGTVRGTFGTGGSYTQIVVDGDFLGSISPIKKAMLHLAVKGYMPARELYSIAKFDYTHFHASIGISDENRGLYPRKTGDFQTDYLYNSSRWVVHRARQINAER